MSKNRLKLQIHLEHPKGARVNRTVRKIVNLVATEWGFPEDECRQIELCFHEAIQNAIEHGVDTGNPVDVHCELTDDRIILVITDPGTGAGNLDALKTAFNSHTTCSPDCENERGRGIFLIRTYMDQAQMECLEGGGVRITMVKNRK